MAIERSWNRLVRFIPRSEPAAPNASETAAVVLPLIGEPVDAAQDVGLASRNGGEIKVEVFEGTSVLDAGKPTGRIEVVERLLSPLDSSEVGSIRCIGLNYKKHAEEGNFAIPSVPMLFLKPDTSLADPYPAPARIPKCTLEHDACDYEAELGVVIGRTAKNVSEAEALGYVLGYTAANDVSSRVAQFEQSQACFSKGFDGACPIGPSIVSTELIPDPSVLHLRGLRNGKVMQDSSLNDLIFSIPKLVSFCSQGTTLRAGTLILTGTPAGVGWMCAPKQVLREGDEYAVEVRPHVGTLVTQFENEK